MLISSQPGSSSALSARQSRDIFTKASMIWLRTSCWRTDSVKVKPPHEVNILQQDLGAVNGEKQNENMLESQIQFLQQHKLMR